MKKNISAFAALCALALAAFAQHTKDDSSPLISLVESERAFSTASAATGVREAFLAFLADDAILFRPSPVNGKRWQSAQPASHASLTWYPIYAKVSRNNDLGYTTGPYEFRQNGPDDKEVGHGNYVSVWKKQPDNTLESCD